MVTVTGLTAERMEAIENSAIVDGAVVGTDLILTRFDESTINAGNVQGPEGEQGPSGSTLFGPRFKSGKYYGPQGSRATATMTAGVLTVVPFWVPDTQIFSRIGAEVITGGVSGTVLRLGIYDDDGDGVPNALVLTAGTVNANTIGSKEITGLSTSLTPGLYWLACVAQGGAPVVRTVANNIIGGAGSSTLAIATASLPHSGYYGTGVTGALPSTFTVVDTTATPALVVLQAA